MGPDPLLICPLCSRELIDTINPGGGSTCRGCSATFLFEHGILTLQTEGGVNLRMSEHLYDHHACRARYDPNGQRIASDVRYEAEVRSVDFSNFHAELLKPYLRNATVADIGCGQIPYLNAFSGYGIKTFYALDLSRESLKLAQKYSHADFPIIFVEAGFSPVPITTSSVDCVISSEVIEHVRDPLLYLSQLYRVLKPGGHLSLSTPCTSIYWYPRRLCNIVHHPKRWWMEYNAHLYWKDVLDWHPALQPSVLRGWLECSGFRVLNHETRLWYYSAPLRPMWRFFGLLERCGLTGAGRLFAKYLDMMERLLSKRIPILKWAGTRQFILAQKMDTSHLAS